MIRVLHILSVLRRGGVETMLMNFYRNIDRSKIQFDFIVHGKVIGEYESEVQQLGGKIYHVRTKKENFIGNLKDIESIIKNNGYKIVEVHQDAMSYFALKAAKKAGAKIRIAHAHSTSMPPSLLGKIIYPYALKRTDKVANIKFSCSHKSSEYLFNGNTDGTIYIYNGIDIQKFTFNDKFREQIRKEHLWQDKFILGQVGNFLYPKNQLFTIDVFKELLKIRPDAQLVFCGSGSDMENCKDKVNEYKLEDHVFFADTVPDVYKWMSAFDCIIMPSFYEGFPVATVEAQCSGLPVLVSDVITDEIIVTNLVKKCSLNSTPGIWAKEISECSVENRSNYSNIVKDNGFDVKSVAKKLEDIYIDSFNKL